MKFSYQNIIDSLPIKKNSNSSWWVKLWVRKASFVFTFIFINLGFSANLVSILSIFTVLGSFTCFLVPGSKYQIIGSLLINFWLILDCVDGNIARCKKQKKLYGEFIDDIGGYFAVAFFYISVGIGAFHSGGFFVEEYNPWMIIIGSITSICDILARLINKDYVSFSKNRDDYTSQDFKTESTNSFSYIRRRIGKELGISGLFMPMIVISVIFNCLDVVIVFYMIFNIVALVVTTVYTIYYAEKYDSDNERNYVQNSLS